MLRKIVRFGFLFLSISACGDMHSNSSLNLTNSRSATKDEYKSVVKLHNLVDGRFCAGVFIAEDKVLTVAHCVYGTSPDKGSSHDTSMAIDNDQGIGGNLRSVAVHSHPAWSEGSDKYGYVNPFDVAIVEFSGAEAAELAELSSKPISAGMRAVLVGFGSRSIQGQLDGQFGNPKQVGKNQIIEVSRGILKMTGAGLTTVTDGSAKDSLPVAGDSGSAVFVDGQLAGLSVTLKKPLGNSRTYEGQIVYLQSEFVRGYIQSFL